MLSAMPELAVPNKASPLARTAKELADVDPFAAKLAFWLDDAFRVPGTNLRFGLDAVLGMIAPGAGDLATGGLGCYLFFVALRRGVPLPIILRMGVNVMIDTLVGAIPVVGDLFDFGWKANARNLALIRRHSGERGPAGVMDWLLVLAATLIVAGVVLTPVILAALFGFGLFSVVNGNAARP